MALCKNCGANIDEGMKFCTSCGTAVEAIPVMPTMEAPTMEAPTMEAPNMPEMNKPTYNQTHKYAINQHLYEQPVNNKTNICALLGFIFSLVCCGGLPGLILSIIGLVQINKTGEKGKGFAIAGIVLFVVGIIVGFVAGFIGGMAEEMYY